MNDLEPEPNEREVPQSRSQPIGRAPLRLAAFDWTGFVAEHFSLSLVGGTFATAIGLVLINPANWPKWLVFAAPVSLLSLALAFSSLLFAFTRVWKTVREEHETSALWGQLVEEVSPRGTGMENVKDAIFEIPYLFSILVLPFSVVCFQALAACLVLFYACDNYYNLALVRKIGTDDCARLPTWLGWVVARGHRLRRLAGDALRGLTGGRWTVSAEPGFALLGAAVATTCSVVDPAPNSIDRVVLMRFFGRRARLDTIAIWLLVGAGVAATILASLDRRELALGVGLLAVLALLALELVVEPFRALGVQYLPATATAGTHGELLLWTVPHGTNLDDQSRAAITEIHEEAFPPAERQYSSEFMVDHSGKSGHLLLMLTERENDAASHAIAGYVFLEARPERDVAFLWYLAIHPDRRGRGHGHWLLPMALEVVRDRWPSIRAVFLEAGHADEVAREDPRSEEMRRIRFYRGLGFTLVGGLDYMIPAEGNPQGSVRYDPMFLSLRGRPQDIQDRFVKEAVREMARDNFDIPTGWRPSGRGEPDPRWKKLIVSMDGMFLVPPDPASPPAHTTT